MLFYAEMSLEPEYIERILYIYNFKQAMFVPSFIYFISGYCKQLVTISTSM